MTPDESSTAPPLITLVHGTFGRLPGHDARWARDGSRLRKELAHQLGDVTFTTFRWSGMNWPSARYRAARRLRDHIALVAAGHPGRPHVVVAHSHGGNVALYALGGPNRALGVQGVVCLSTPFIAVQPRPATPSRVVGTHAVLLVALFALVANLSGILLAPWLGQLHGGDPVIRTFLLNEIWLEFAICAVSAWYLTRALIRLARRREREIAIPLPLPPLAVIRSVGDEASALLAASAFFSWLVVLIWRAASLVTLLLAGAFALSVLWPLGLVAAALLAVERGFTRRGPVRRLLPRLWRSTKLAAGVVALGVLLAYAAWGALLHDTPLSTIEQSYGWTVVALFAAVGVFSRLSGLGYGLTAPFLEVTTEPVPVGVWTVRLFPAWRWPEAGSEPGRAGLLAHSAAYNNDEVLWAVAEWIRTVVELAGQGGGGTGEQCPRSAAVP